jgi:uncharacterized protein HemX
MQLTVFPTLPVMNVLDAPVLPCSSPPTPTPTPPATRHWRYSSTPLVLAISSPIALALAIAAGAVYWFRRRRAKQALADENGFAAAQMETLIN